jgi:hypothetical protein
MCSPRVARTAFAVIVLLAPGGLPAAAGQTPGSPGEVETDSDPTRPVFVSLRPEFHNFDQQHRQLFIGRYDTRWRVVILRFEAPIVRTDDGQRATTGLGDVYGQFLLVPYASPRFAVVIGNGVILPTAVDSRLGGGNWVLAPIASPLWRFSRGLAYVKLQNFTSVGGPGDGPPINYLLVTPTFIRGMGRAWWVLADTETKTNWREDGRTGVKSGLQIGRHIANGVGVWVKPEVWWGPNRDGIWNLKLGVVWYQRRGPTR